jgi:hypothetical protein
MLLHVSAHGAILRRYINDLILLNYAFYMDPYISLTVHLFPYPRIICQRSTDNTLSALIRNGEKMKICRPQDTYTDFNFWKEKSNIVNPGYERHNEIRFF